jgi:hypothetical protein
VCIGAPKIPKTPPPAQYQQMQVPKDMMGSKSAFAQRRRRGLWASIFTSPQGVTGAPTVTGSGSGVTGG